MATGKEVRANGQALKIVQGWLGSEASLEESDSKRDGVLDDKFPVAYTPGLGLGFQPKTNSDGKGFEKKFKRRLAGNAVFPLAQTNGITGPKVSKNLGPINQEEKQSLADETEEDEEDAGRADAFKAKHQKKAETEPSMPKKKKKRKHQIQGAL